MLGTDDEIGITELSQRVMVSKSTVYHIPANDEILQVMSCRRAIRKILLTLKLFKLGVKTHQHIDFICIVDIYMRVLSNLMRATIHLGELDEDSIIYIHKINSQYNLRMYSRVGGCNPRYDRGIGKVLLVWRDITEPSCTLASLIFTRRTSRTAASQEVLLQELWKV